MFSNEVDPPPERFSMLDKTTGEQVGILTLMQGHGVPDLNRVELCKINESPESFNHGEAPNDSEDINGNNLGHSIKRSRDIFEGEFDMRKQLKSGIKTDTLKAKLGSLSHKEINRSDIVKNVMTEIYMKPFKLGWLRRVAVKYSQGGNFTFV